MARVCPVCRRLTADEESLCRQCGNPTVEPAVWQVLRQTFPKPGAVATPDAEQTVIAAENEQNEAWIKTGLGGMLAALLFFVVYLIAYLVYFH
jgi:hypothetical protein